MNLHAKRRIAFALSMGLVTTAIISFVLLALSLGIDEGFLVMWLRGWVTSYVIVIPAIFFIGPRLQARVDRLIQ